MTARNDPLARVQAMVDAWGSAGTFDTFDTSTSEVSPRNRQENRGFRHSRHFRHHQSEHPDRREQSADVYLEERLEQGNGSRVSYSHGVESVESVENLGKDRKDSALIFDTSSLQVSKNGARCRKRACQTGLEDSSAPCRRASGMDRRRRPTGHHGAAPHLSGACLAAADHRRRAVPGGLGAQAAALGWPDWELFGCHRRAPWGRIQGMGLVLLLHGDQLAALTASEAVIRRPSGAHQTWRRKPSIRSSRRALPGLGAR